jgi:hypothetical protein
MPRMRHLRSAVFGPDDNEFARGTRNVPNLLFDLDVPEGRTQCTVFARVRGKLMKHELQRPCQGRFKIDVRPGCEDLSAICRLYLLAYLGHRDKPSRLRAIDS